MKNFRGQLQFNDLADAMKHINKNTYTIEQYAKKKKIGYRQGKEHVRTGKIPTIRPKATVLIDKKEIKK